MGHHHVHVGVQRRGRHDDLLDMVPGDVLSATWTLACTAAETPSGLDLKGPYIQGSPSSRFIYLSWGDVESEGGFTMFRRAKLMLDAIPETVMERAVHSGLLVGKLGLTDSMGGPVCAAVRPPAITWSAGKAR
jgi:hypothetical protein